MPAKRRVNSESMWTFADWKSPTLTQKSGFNPN